MSTLYLGADKSNIKICIIFRGPLESRSTEAISG